MSFVDGFTKTAGEDGWSTVQSLLGRLPQGPFKVGDTVAYDTRIKWTNEPDGKHTKSWPGCDFKTDGIKIGDMGTVVAVKKKDIKVRWKLHELFKKPYASEYQPHELRLLPTKEKK